MKARILLLSSDAVLAEWVRFALAGLPVECCVAGNREDFERLTERVVYDLVLIVGIWPFRCGAEVLRRVRPPALRRPEVYLLAWQHAEQTVLGLLECGVDQYMTFPLHLGRLRKKVEGALTR